MNMKLKSHNNKNLEDILNTEDPNLRLAMFFRKLVKNTTLSHNQWHRFSCDFVVFDNKGTNDNAVNMANINVLKDDRGGSYEY